MVFNKLIEDQQIEGDSKVTYREAIRAVIVRKNKGDYKFPGGGVEEYIRLAVCFYESG